MDFACPECAASLAESIPRPLPGARLSPHRQRVCPHCGIELRFNWHPQERRIQGVLLALIFCAVVLNYGTGDVRWLLLLGGAAFIGELLFMGWCGRRLARWPRYRRAGS